MKIKFIPTGQEIDVNPNKTLLQLCNEAGIEIKSICKGVPSCAECRVNIAAGEHNILPPSKAELSLIGTNYFIDSRRLSCQVRCFGDVTVDLTDQLARAESQTKKTRGYRATKGMQTETSAKQGTLVLEEADKKPEPQAQNPQGEPRAPREPRPQRQQQNRNQQRGGGNSNSGGGNKPQQQNAGGNRPQGSGGGGGKRNNNNSRPPNPNQNRQQPRPQNNTPKKPQES